VFPTANSPLAGAFYQFGLQAGDTGVRSVQSLTLNTSWVSGTINLVAYRVLSIVEITNNNYPNAVDLLTGGFPKIYNGVVPFIMYIPISSTASYISGQVIWSQG
jgi:hypothetical protein